MKTFFMMMSLVAVLVLVECAVVAAVPVLIPEANVGATPDRPITEEELNLESGIADDMFEGDIKLTPKQKELMNMNDEVHESAFRSNRNQHWPGGVVPYVLDYSLGPAQRNGINRAIQEYHAKTCIRFKRRERERDYVRFVRRNGCYSRVGRVGGHQEISIGNGCQKVGIVIHEIFHALGRWHEQSRPDRDQYIRVNYNNIKDRYVHNFRKERTTTTTTSGVSYDYFSLMHYDAYAFSRNRQPTIVPLNLGISPRHLGQRGTFSPKDLQHVNALYSCVADESTNNEWSKCSRQCNGYRWRMKTSLPYFDFEVCNENCRETVSKPRVDREAGSQLKERETGSEPKVDKEIKNPQPRFKNADMSNGLTYVSMD